MPQPAEGVLNEGIGAMFSWRWTTIMQPVIAFIGERLQVIRLAFRMLYQTFIKPAFDAIDAVFKWIWNSIIRPTFDLIGKAVGARR